jgi:hypothetical protein
LLACNLDAISARDRTRDRHLFKQIQAAIIDRRELADGYVFRLNGESLSLPDIAQWVSFERLCCPFFTFQLQTTGEESDYRLILRGPDGTKAIINSCNKCRPAVQPLPSLAMIGTMTRPATGSAHHRPNAAFKSNPPSSMADRYVDPNDPKSLGEALRK